MRDIFESHPVSVLKKEISKSNIKGYSKMKKKEVVDLMMKNKEKFSYIKMAEKKEKKSKGPAKKKKPFLTATKASGEVVELKERKKKKEEPKKKEQSQKKRLQKALKLWDKNKSKNIDPETGKPTEAYERLRQRMVEAKSDAQIRRKIDQFSQVIKVKI